MSACFRFKQFSIRQDRSAMKVGTDGVLLGAWADLSGRPNTVLDVGAGTGLIALMLAQRGDSQTIDAVERDPDAYVEAVGNFEESPWGDRLFCYHADFREFYEEMEEQYDLIVSNPPYFEETDPKCRMTRGRRQARFTSALSFEALLEGSRRLLSSQGRLALIAPWAEEGKILEHAMEKQLFLQKRCRVRGRKETPVKRSMMLFGLEHKKIETAELVIEISRHQYTPEYRELTKDFYLDL